jgi:Cdc6-like AAA superfamily ATPase
MAIRFSKSITELNLSSQTSFMTKERGAIIDWLAAIDYGRQQSDFISRRQEGTGQWLLDSSEFKEWLAQKSQTLFCPGIPGAGKTIFTSIVIDYLEKKFQNDNSIKVTYVYCNFRQQHEQKPADLLASILKQLVQQQLSIPQSVKSLYERHKDKRTRPSVGEISKALRSTVTDYQRAFIIIDALDECQASGANRAKFLTEIFNLQAKTGANLFATSRFIPEIEKEFKGSVSLEIRASDEDVCRYLDGHMSRLPSFILRSPDLQEEIKTEIIKVADGMYVPFKAVTVDQGS